MNQTRNVCMINMYIPYWQHSTFTIHNVWYPMGGVGLKDIKIITYMNQDRQMMVRG